MPKITYFNTNVAVFCGPFFFEEYLNHPLWINTMAKEHTVDYHPIHSGLTSRI